MSRGVRAGLAPASSLAYLGNGSWRCPEREAESLLRVRWTSMPAHEQSSRLAPRYLDWKPLLHRFDSPFPTVLHDEAVPGTPDR